jgi:hypothetical protein
MKVMVVLVIFEPLQCLFLAESPERSGFWGGKLFGEGVPEVATFFTALDKPVCHEQSNPVVYRIGRNLIVLL